MLGDKPLTVRNFAAAGKKVLPAIQGTRSNGSIDGPRPAIKSPPPERAKQAGPFESPPKDRKSVARFADADKYGSIGSFSDNGKLKIGASTFGYGERFKAKAHGTPGPGSYDPKDLTYKIDTDFGRGVRFKDLPATGGLWAGYKPEQRKYMPVPRTAKKRVTWANDLIQDMGERLAYSLQDVKAKEKEAEKDRTDKELRDKEKKALLAAAEKDAPDHEKLSNALKRIGDLERQIEDLRGQQGQAVNDRVAEMEALLEGLREAAKGLEAPVNNEALDVTHANPSVAVSELLRRVAELEDEVVALKAKNAELVAENDNLAAAVGSLQNKLAAIDPRELDKSVKLINTLKSDLPDMVKLKDEGGAADASVKLHALGQQLEALKALKLKVMVDKAVQVSDGAQENAGLQRKIKGLEAQCATLTLQLNKEKSDAATGTDQEYADKATLTDGRSVEAMEAEIADLKKVNAAWHAKVDEQKDLAAKTKAQHEAEVAKLKGEVAKLVEAYNTNVLTLKNRIGDGDKKLKEVWAEDQARKAQIGKLTVELEAQKTANAGLASDKEMLEGELEALRAELEKIKGELSAEVAKSTGLAADKEMLEGELEALRAELEKSKGELEGLRAELESCKGELSAEVAKSEGLAADKEMLEGELEAMRQLLNSLKKEEDELKASLDALSSTKEVLSRDFEDVANGKQALSAEVDALRNALDVVEVSKGALDAELTAAKGSLEKAGSEIEALKAKVELGKSDRDALKVKMTSQIQKEKARADAALAQSAKTAAELEAAKKANDDLNAKLAAAKADADKAAAAAAAALAAAKKQSAKLATELDSLRKQKDGATQNAATLQADLTNLKRDNGALGDELAALKAQLAAALAEIESSKKQNTKLTKDLADKSKLKKQLEFADAEMDALTKQRDALQAKLDAAAEERATMRKESDAALAAVNAQMALVTQNAEDIQAQAGKLVEKAFEERNKLLKQMEEQASESDARIKELDANAAASEADKAKLAAMLEQLQAEANKAMTAAMTREESLKARAEGLQGKLSETEKKVKEALATPTSDQEMLEKQVKFLQATMNRKMSEAQERADQMSRENENLKKMVARKKDEIRALEDELDALRKALAAMQKDLEAARAEAKVQGQRARESEARLITEKALGGQEVAAKLNKELDTKEAVIKRLEFELNSALEGMKGEKQTLSDENIKLRGDIDKLTADLNAALGDSDMKGKALDSLHAELDGAYSKLKAAFAAKAKLEKDAKAERESMQDQARALQDDYSTALMQTRSTNDQVLALQKELAATRDAMEAALQDAEAARQEAADAHEEAERFRQLAEDAEVNKMEVQRLTAVNAMMAQQLINLEADLKNLMDMSNTNLGHNNPAQKVQYHLRLKQELEELRAQCTVLLRDKFQLEQCVRYLSVRLMQGGGSLADQEKINTKNLPKNPMDALLPQSLASNYMYSTPLMRKAMAVGGKAKGMAGTLYDDVDKDGFEDAIRTAKKDLVDEVTSWRHGAIVDSSAVNVNIKHTGGEMPEGSSGKRAVDAINAGASADEVIAAAHGGGGEGSDPNMQVVVPATAAETVEARIIARINEVVGGGPDTKNRVARKSSHSKAGRQGSVVSDSAEELLVHSPYRNTVPVPPSSEVTKATASVMAKTRKIVAPGKYVEAEAPQPPTPTAPPFKAAPAPPAPLPAATPSKTLEPLRPATRMEGPKIMTPSPQDKVQQLLNSTPLSRTTSSAPQGPGQLFERSAPPPKSGSPRRPAVAGVLLEPLSPPGSAELRAEAPPPQPHTPPLPQPFLRPAITTPAYANRGPVAATGGRRPAV